MDLLDVESELRSHLASRPVPRAPGDLAQRTRLRHRRQRRQQAAVAGAVLAVVAVFGSIPALRAVLPTAGTADDGAAPARERAAALYDLPTRGSLAGDSGWLAEVAALPWETPAPGGGDVDPPVDSHRVAFAEDVAGARIALVLGQEDGLVSGAWFTGTADAAPDEMAQATQARRVLPTERPALLDAPGADAPGVLVVLAQPGEEVWFTPGMRVEADGDEEQVPWAELETRDGAAVEVLDVAVDHPLGQVQVLRDGDVVEEPSIALSDRARQLSQQPVAVADPRGLRGGVDEEALQSLVHQALGYYALPAEQLRPTLLATGAVGADPVALIGFTHPSGATSSWLLRLIAVADPAGPLGTTTSTTTWSSVAADGAAGTALADRVFAVPTDGGLVVSGPAGGVAAEVLERDGTSLTTLPLTDGVGAGVVPPGAPAEVRITDAAGTVLVEAPVTP